MNTNYTLNQILIIVYTTIALFVFSNKAYSEEVGISFSTNNEIIYSEKDYLIVGNIDYDFNSIKYFADRYCAKNKGAQYSSSSTVIGVNIVYAYCVTEDELYEYKLTDTERNCFYTYDVSRKIKEDAACNINNINYEKILNQVRIYRKKINELGSKAFIYNLLDKNISKKITEFEKKTLIIDTQKDLKNKLLNIQDPISRNIDAAILQEKLKIEIIILEDPLQVKFDTMQKNRNIKICDSYGFIRETDKYFECLLILIEIDTNRNFFIK